MARRLKKMLSLAPVAGLYFGNVTVKKEATMSKSVRTFAFNFWGTDCVHGKFCGLSISRN